MGIKHSKETKVEACKDYERGSGSFQDIAKRIGTSRSVIHRWYLRYIEHGSSAFESPKSFSTYKPEFKLSVVKEYTSAKHSICTIAAKYNVSENIVRKWINKCYNGIETKDYNPKGDIYTMKTRKTTYEERLAIVNWVIENNMNYNEAVNRFSLNYALIYKWTNDYIKNGSEALKYKKRGPKPKSKRNEKVLGDIEKLKIELTKEKALRKQREFEIEVLKKKEEFEQELHSRK